MKWHYAAGRKTGDGPDHWQVYEVYEESCQPTLFTESGVTPGAETRLRLVDDLARMLKDVCYFPAIDADAEEYTEL